jgi:hypothetical protein
MKQRLTHYWTWSTVQKWKELAKQARFVNPGADDKTQYLNVLEHHIESFCPNVYMKMYYENLPPEWRNSIVHPKKNIPLDLECDSRFPNMNMAIKLTNLKEVKEPFGKNMLRAAQACAVAKQMSVRLGHEVLVESDGFLYDPKLLGRCLLAMIGRGSIRVFRDPIRHFTPTLIKCEDTSVIVINPRFYIDIHEYSKVDLRTFVYKGEWNDALQEYLDGGYSNDPHKFGYVIGCIERDLVKPYIAKVHEKLGLKKPSGAIFEEYKRACMKEINPAGRPAEVVDMFERLKKYYTRVCEILEDPKAEYSACDQELRSMAGELFGSSTENT